jgi:hypothetical protein
MTRSTRDCPARRFGSQRWPVIEMVSRNEEWTKTFSTAPQSWGLPRMAKATFSLIVMPLLNPQHHLTPVPTGYPNVPSGLSFCEGLITWALGIGAPRACDATQLPDSHHASNVSYEGLTVTKKSPGQSMLLGLLQVVASACRLF